MQMSVACQVLASWPDLANKAVPCREEAIINQKQHFCHPKSESASCTIRVSVVCVGFSQWAFALNFKLKFIANSWQRPRPKPHNKQSKERERERERRLSWIRVNVAPENVGRLGFYANSVRAPCFDGAKVGRDGGGAVRWWCQHTGDNGNGGWSHHNGGVKSLPQRRINRSYWFCLATGQRHWIRPFWKWLSFQRKFIKKVFKSLRK